MVKLCKEVGSRAKEMSIKMDNDQLSLRKTEMRSFWGAYTRPWKKHPGMMVVGVVVFASAIRLSSAYMDPLLNRAMHVDGLALGHIASEMFFETDAKDDSHDTLAIHREYIEQYSGIRDRSIVSRLVEFLYPNRSSKKALKGAVAHLEDGGKSVSDSLLNAGTELSRFFQHQESIPLGKRTALAKLPNRPKKLGRMIEKSLAESKKAVSDFLENPTVGTARVACSENRKTVMIFVDGWRYRGDMRMGDFRDEVSRAVEKMDWMVLNGHYENNKEKEDLGAWVKSEKRRVNILDAMIDENVREVRKLVAKAISIGLENCAQNSQ